MIGQVMGQVMIGFNRGRRLNQICKCAYNAASYKLIPTVPEGSMVQKYGGELVYALRDEIGLIEVVETAGVRALHFGSVARQSAMSIVKPDRVELSYIRGMLMNLLYVPQPRNVLLLGLGGGSLAKFLLQHCPECQIEAVEYRAAVPTVARRFFGLPVDSRFRVHLEDCNAYMVRGAKTDRLTFDHIYVDVYDCQGLAESVNRHGFFSACKSLLHPKGILAINLWGTRVESLRESLRLLNFHFGGRVLRLDIPGRGNVIAFTHGESYGVPKPRNVTERAGTLEIQTGIEFTRFAKIIRLPASFRTD